MKKLTLLLFIFLGMTCTSQQLFAESIPLVTAKLVATSPDDQFFLLNNDSAWFIMTEAQDEFADLAANNEILANFQIDDQIVISKEETSPFFKLTHANNRTELIALKVDAVVQQPVADVRLEEIIELDNGLLLRTCDAFSKAVSRGSWITVAVLNQDFSYLGQNYHCDMQWISTTYRKWLFQKVQEDVVKGKITKTELELEYLDDPHTITSVSHDNKTIQLGNCTTYINTDPIGRDKDNIPYIEPWQKGDQLELGSSEGQIIPIKNQSTETTMFFLHPSLQVKSQIKEHIHVTVTNKTHPQGIDYLWAELENGIIVQISPVYQTHFAIGEQVIYTFLNANEVPQKEGKATAKYHNMFNPQNNWDFSRDFSYQSGAFRSTSREVTSGYFRQ